MRAIPADEPRSLSALAARGQRLEGAAYQATLRVAMNEQAFREAIRKHVAMKELISSTRMAFVKPALVMTGDDIDRMRMVVAAFSMFMFGGDC